MPREESLYPADWSRLAERDWQRVERLLAGQDPELAGFCLQQAVEKFLKAFLLSHGWKLRRIHDLDALLDDAVIYDESLEDFHNVCQLITAFYFMERYPFIVETGPIEDDVRNACEQVKDLIDKIRTWLERPRKES